MGQVPRPDPIEDLTPGLRKRNSDLNRHFFKEDIQMTNRHTKNSQTANAGGGVERREPSYSIGGNVNWYSHYGEQYGGSLKN